MEPKSTKLVVLFVLIISSLLILFAISFSPDFVVNNLSHDGSLESITTLKINGLRITAATIGILVLPFSIFRPTLFYSLSWALRSLPERTIYALIFLASIVIAIFACMGQVGLHTVSYEVAAQALVIESGKGLGTPIWPPGHALLMIPFIKCGLSPLRAAWLISLASFAVANVIIYVYVRRLATPLGGAIATVLFAFNPVIIQWANMATTEMLFICTTLAAFSAFDFYYLRDDVTTRYTSFLDAFIIGFLLATPFWIRYIGIVVPLIGSASLALLFYWAPHQRTKILTSILSMMFFLIPLIIRNMILAGNLTGHPMGAQPAETFVSAMARSLRYIGNSWPYSVDFLPEKIVVITMTALLFLLALSSMKRPRLLIISCFPILYVITLAYVASHTRIDDIGNRFVIPTFPYLAMSLSLMWHNYATSSQALRIETL